MMLRSPIKLSCSFKESGGVFIELAIVLPILVLLCLLTLEISLAISDYKLILQRVGVATRYLSTQPPGTGYFQAKCLVAFGNFTCTQAGSDYVYSQLDPTSSSGGLATINIYDSLNTPSSMNYLRTDASSVNGVKLNLVKLEVANYNHQLLLGDYLYNTINLSTPGVLRFNNISLTMRQAN